MYTGWSIVHWNTTGMSWFDQVYTVMPLVDPVNTFRVHWNTTAKIIWNCPPLECHLRNSDYCSLHWNTTEGTVTAPHTQKHIVKHSSFHASLKWQNRGTPSSNWTGLCKFSFYLEFTALRRIPVLFFKCVNASTPLCACLGFGHHNVFFVYLGCSTHWLMLAPQWCPSGKQC